MIYKKNVLHTAVSLLLLSLLTSPVVLAKKDNDKKEYICHGTGSGKYLILHVSKNSHFGHHGKDGSKHDDPENWTDLGNGFCSPVVEPPPPPPPPLEPVDYCLLLQPDAGSSALAGFEAVKSLIRYDPNSGEVSDLTGSTTQDTHNVIGSAQGIVPETLVEDMVSVSLDIEQNGSEVPYMLAEGTSTGVDETTGVAGYSFNYVLYGYSTAEEDPVGTIVELASGTATASVAGAENENLCQLPE